MDPPPAGDESPSTVDGDPQPAEPVQAPSDLSPAAADTNTESPAPQQPPKAPRMCGVCNDSLGKYKCPRCDIAYCSVACNRTHNENHPPPAPRPTPASSLPTAPPAHEDPYSILLEHRADFARLFRKHPDLEATLARIQEATLPPAAGTTTNWKVRVPGQTHKEVWSRDVGLRTGAAVLRRERAAGEDVAEYCELVLHLLSRGGAEDAARVARREVAAEEARAVERLIVEEAERPGR